MTCLRQGVEIATDELNKGIIQSLTKENAELKAQIEKMKCCGNCKYQGEDYFGNSCCSKDKSAWDCDSWDIKENENK